MLTNMTQAETNEHNRQHCIGIAENLETIAEGRAYRCAYCGDLIDPEEYSDDEELYDAIANGDECECPLCGHEDFFEEVTVYDWLDNALDFTYTIDRDGSYRGCRVMVAFGGPTIYVDTMRGKVELFWWTDRAECDLTHTAVEELDACVESYYECTRY